MSAKHKQNVSIFAQADKNRIAKLSVTGLRMPGLEGPILSAGVLTDDNVDVHLSKNGSWLKLPGSGKKLPLIKRKGTYYLRVIPDEEKNENTKGQGKGRGKGSGKGKGGKLGVNGMNGRSRQPFGGQP